MLHLYHLKKIVFENMSNLNSGTFSVFPAFERKMVKFLVKLLRRDFAYKVNTFVFHYI